MWLTHLGPSGLVLHCAADRLSSRRYRSSRTSTELSCRMDVPGARYQLVAGFHSAGMVRYMESTCGPARVGRYASSPGNVHQSFFRTSLPVWLLLVAASFHSRMQSIPWWPLAPAFVAAGLQSLVAVGASENFRLAAPLCHSLRTFDKGIAATVLICAALVTPRLGGLASWVGPALTVVAVSCIYAPANPTHPDVVKAVYWVALCLMLVATSDGGKTRRAISAACLLSISVHEQHLSPAHLNA
jgi:hypothetical protein